LEDHAQPAGHPRRDGGITASAAVAFRKIGRPSSTTV